MADKDLTTQMGELGKDYEFKVPQEAPQAAPKSALGYFIPQADIPKTELYGITIEEALQNQFNKLETRAKDPDKPKTPAELETSKRPFSQAVEGLEALGMPRKTDLAVLNNEKAMMELVERTLAPALVEGIDPEKHATIMRARVKLFSSLATIVNMGKPSQLANALLDTEKRLMEADDARAFNRQRWQRTGTAKKLSLPKVTPYSKALNEGIKNIPDKEARAFTALTLMTGLRGPEFPRLLTEIPESGSGYWFDPEHSTVKFYNKGAGTITDYHLGSNAAEILKEMQEDARKEGRKNIFSKKAPAYRKIGLPYMRKAIKDAGLTPAILRKTGQPTAFTYGHLRKNLFSIAKDMVGTDAANAILGHSVKGDIGMDFYAVERQGEISKAGKAVDSIFRKFGLDIGKTGPRNIFKTWQFKKAADAVPATFPNVDVDPAAQKAIDTSADVETKTVVVGQGLDEAEKTLENKASRLEGTIKRIDDLQDQVGKLTGKGKTRSPAEKPPITIDLSNIDYSARGYSPEDVKAILEAKELGDTKAVTAAVQMAEHNKSAILSSKVKQIFQGAKKGAKVVAPFLPYVGGAFGVMAVSETQAAEKKQYAEQGVPTWLDYYREFQKGEEMFSPFPITTHDVEQGVKYISEETPKTMAKQVEQEMDPTPAGGFARQQAGQFKSTLVDDYEGFIPTR